MSYNKTSKYKHLNFKRLKAPFEKRAIIELKRNMNFRTLAYLTFLLLAIANANTICSQTCRIKIGSQTNGCPIYTEVFEYDFVDEKPEFPGGGNQMINFINSTREYPHEAYQSGIQGRVTCAFVVQPDGKISHIKVLRGVESSLNNEAIRIISLMPDWIPGRINNQPVPVRVVTCIPFRK